MADLLFIILRLLATAFAAFWLYCAIFNAAVAWTVFVRRRAQGPSHIPLAGGWLAYTGVILWSMSDQLLSGSRGFPLLPFLWLPPLLDFGCLPALIIWGIPALLNEARRRGP